MKSLEDLQALRDKELAILGIRQGSDLVGKPKVTVCMGTCGIAAGARDVLAALVESVAKEKLSREVIVGQTACPSFCDAEPVIVVKTADGAETTYIDMTPAKVLEVIERHIKQGEIIVEYTK